MIIRLLISFLFLSSFANAAPKHFDFNQHCQHAYQEILSLKLQAGQQLLNAEKARDPDNLVPYLLENYIDFFILFFNEDEAEYKKRYPNREKRLSQLEKGPSSSPFFLFSTSVVHFQWAVIRIKFGHNWDAGWEFRRSFVQVRDNAKKFPSFMPNQMFRGAMQVAAGTIPDGYKWLSNLLGIRGTIQDGMQELRTFLQSPDPTAKLYHNEGIFYFCYLSYYIENEKEGVLNFIRDQRLDLVNNHLFAYLAANLSIQNQRAESAIAILDARNDDDAYMQSPVWDLEKGYALLYKNDKDAVVYLERFVNNFKGKFYVKDALQKISWIWYLRGDQRKADQYRKLIATKGSSESEADKQANEFSPGKDWPNKLLLQARLYSDGGYHREALRILHGKSANDFTLPVERLEFNYRAGRIYDDIGRDDAAIAYYRIAVETGRSRKEYFGSRAALQIGYIYEKRQNCAEANKWFTTCLAMKEHEYKNGIDQRAKAGLERCKKH